MSLLFKYQGTDITTIAEVVSKNTSDPSISTTSVHTSAFFSSPKLRGVLYNDGQSISNKTLANAPSGYPWSNNITGSKLKVRGVADSVSRKGYRPKMLTTALDTYTTLGASLTSSTYEVRKQSDGSIAITYTSGTIIETCVPAIYDAKYIYVLVQGAGGAGGGGEGGGGADGGGGGGGGGGGACLLLVPCPNVGTILSVSGGSPASGGSGSNTSGSTSGGTGPDSVVKVGNTTVITVHGGYGGAPSSGNNHAGGSGRGCTKGTIPSGWYYTTWTGANGGKGGRAGNATTDATAGGNCGTVTITSSTKLKNDGGTEYPIIPSGERTYSWTTWGGNSGGSKGGGGGGGSPFCFSNGYSAWVSNGYNASAGGGPEADGTFGIFGSGGGGGGGHGTWFTRGGIGGNADNGFIWVWY